MKIYYNGKYNIIDESGYELTYDKLEEIPKFK